MLARGEIIQVKWFHDNKDCYFFVTFIILLMCLGMRNPPGWKCCPSYWRILTTTPSPMPYPSTCSMEHIRSNSWDPSPTSIPLKCVRSGTVALPTPRPARPHAQWKISGQPLVISPSHPVHLDGERLQREGVKESYFVETYNLRNIILTMPPAVAVSLELQIHYAIALNMP